MPFDDFDSSPLDGLDKSARTLDRYLRKGETSFIGVRAGYDNAPRQHDLKEVLDLREDVEGDLMPAEYLYDCIDEHFDEGDYVDWTTDGFEDLEQVEEYDYEVADLVVEVYEPGEDGRDILRL